jgi:hypothetical protein
MDLPPAPDAACETLVTRPAPVTVLSPAAQTVPLVFASPHSGRAYPADFVAAARLDALSLRRSEDSFVDELFAAAPASGAPLIAANFPRAFCDPNREPWELDPAMFEEALPHWVNTTSARVGAGLGTIARVVASGETIYREKLNFAEVEARIRCCWHPFHDALRQAIDATRRQFGVCLLIDCHSMPGSSMAPKTPAPRASPGRLNAAWWRSATRCAGTTHTPAATSPAITAARASTFMRCKWRSVARFTWMRRRSNGCRASPGCNAISRR